jgi:hypothetical protein
MASMYVCTDMLAIIKDHRKIQIGYYAIEI